MTSGAMFTRRVRGDISPKNVVLFAIFLLLLLLCGDIHTNPGPVRYPCGICRRPVAKNHRALMCQDCDVWVHIKCCGVEPSLYDSYMKGVGLSDWQCPLCHQDKSSEGGDLEHSSLDKPTGRSSDSESETDEQVTPKKSNKPINSVRIAVINVNS